MQYSFPPNIKDYYIFDKSVPSRTHTHTHTRETYRKFDIHFFYITVNKFDLLQFINGIYLCVYTYTYVSEMQRICVAENAYRFLRVYHHTHLYSIQTLITVLSPTCTLETHSIEFVNVKSIDDKNVKTEYLVNPTLNVESELRESLNHHPSSHKRKIFSRYNTQLYYIYIYIYLINSMIFGFI